MTNKQTDIADNIDPKRTQFKQHAHPMFYCWPYNDIRQFAYIIIPYNNQP